MNHVDHAHKAGDPIHDRGCAAQHLNLFDVSEIKRCQSGVECAAPWHTVHNQQERIEFAQSPQTWHGTSGTAVAAGRDINTGD